MEMCKVVVLVAVVSCKMATSSRRSRNSLSQRVDRLESLLTGDVTPGHNRSVNESSVPCPSDFYLHKATSSCYRIMDESKSWYEAREDCLAQGADLIWYETPVEYRHVVIKLLTVITKTKEFNNEGYWSGANDITGQPLVWGDTNMVVMTSFIKQQTTYNDYDYDSRSSSSSDKSQKHCVFVTYTRTTMTMTQELSECDGERLYICKCKTRGPGSCEPPSKQAKIPKKQD